MLDETEVIAEVLESIQTACQDYFLWSHGCTIYDHGVEALMHVYGARRLFELFSPRFPVMVRMEHRLADILPGTAGRADLTMSIANGPIFIIEYKRYFNRSSIARDLGRLRNLSAIPQLVGVLAGPCFIRDGVDWPVQFVADITNMQQRYAPQITDARPLPPAFKHPKGYNQTRAIAVRVHGEIAPCGHL